jgi:hypothetical protein
LFLQIFEALKRESSELESSLIAESLKQRKTRQVNAKPQTSKKWTAHTDIKQTDNLMPWLLHGLYYNCLHYIM